jgi:hypothetical protein
MTSRAFPNCPNGTCAGRRMGFSTLRVRKHFTDLGEEFIGCERFLAKQHPILEETVDADDLLRECPQMSQNQVFLSQDGTRTETKKAHILVSSSFVDRDGIPARRRPKDLGGPARPPAMRRAGNRRHMDFQSRQVNTLATWRRASFTGLSTGYHFSPWRCVLWRHISK